MDGVLLSRDGALENGEKEQIGVGEGMWGGKERLGREAGSGVQVR